MHTRSKRYRRRHRGRQRDAARRAEKNITGHSNRLALLVAHAQAPACLPQVKCNPSGHDEPPRLPKGLSAVANKGWLSRFDDPIVLDDGTNAHRLRSPGAVTLYLCLAQKRWLVVDGIVAG